MTEEFPAQRASNAENASIWWRHHGGGKLWRRGKTISTDACNYDNDDDEEVEDDGDDDDDDNDDDEDADAFLANGDKVNQHSHVWINTVKHLI